MCCFTLPVEHVADTCIFARAEGAVQTLVYRMTYAAEQPLAMVLPLPVPPGSPEDALEFVDLESCADFFAQMEKLAPRFEPHPINREFLNIFASAGRETGAPKSLGKAVACAAVSILPPMVRERLQLGADYDLKPLARMALKTLGAIAERVPPPNSPPVEACKRLGLPGDFLYRSRRAQAELLAKPEFQALQSRA